MSKFTLDGAMQDLATACAEAGGVFELCISTSDLFAWANTACDATEERGGWRGHIPPRLCRALAHALLAKADEVEGAACRAHSA